MVYGALDRWVALCSHELSQALRIHAVHKKKYSFGLKIRDKQICYPDHIWLMYVALMQSRDLCRGEEDQHPRSGKYQ